MSTGETQTPAVATRAQEEAPESAEAIADRILGNTQSFEMSSLSETQPAQSISTPVPGILPTVVSSSGNTSAQASAVTNVEVGTAATPITDANEYRVSEALHGDAAPVSPSDILTRALVITIIIPSTDSRHRYVLDDNYLAKRSVSPPEGVIKNMSVYTLKELIWRDWRPEWEQRPTNPSSIRLIHMGRMLDDNTFLRDNRFQVGETPHVVHMNVRPELVEEEDGGKIGKTSSRARSRRNADGEEERTPGCRCSLM